MVTWSLIKRRSSPSTARAVVRKDRAPASIRLMTTNAVKPLTPHAMANWVSVSLGILCLRSANPNAADHESALADPPRSRRRIPTHSEFGHRVHDISH
jgi:hypothetical protein